MSLVKTHRRISTRRAASCQNSLARSCSSSSTSSLVLAKTVSSQTGPTGTAAAEGADPAVSVSASRPPSIVDLVSQLPAKRSLMECLGGAAAAAKGAPPSAAPSSPGGGGSCESSGTLDCPPSPSRRATRAAARAAAAAAGKDGSASYSAGEETSSGSEGSGSGGGRSGGGNKRPKVAQHTNANAAPALDPNAGDNANASSDASADPIRRPQNDALRIVSESHTSVVSESHSAGSVSLSSGSASTEGSAGAADSALASASASHPPKPSSACLVSPERRQSPPSGGDETSSNSSASAPPSSQLHPVPAGPAPSTSNTDGDAETGVRPSTPICPIPADPNGAIPVPIGSPTHQDSPKQPSHSHPPSPPPPLKALTMEHLRKKYLEELEYMRTEFCKLERQLLGSRASAQAEPQASRERREKLHSFIVHLEETIKQIKEGCRLESQGEGRRPTALVGSEAKQEFADNSALTKLTREKEEEETVQKLEEHILANLLPVKVRLTKQLAAQQGATKNPVGMPSSARAPRPSAAAIGKGTFAAAAEERRRREEEARPTARGVTADGGSMSSSAVLSPPTTTSLLGKPICVGGSSLTKKLHGKTLGAHARAGGEGVGQSSASVPSNNTGTPSSSRGRRSPHPASAGRCGTNVADSPASFHTASTAEDGLGDEMRHPVGKPMLYAGMALGSQQVSSSISAAQGAHDMVVTDPNLRVLNRAGLAFAAAEKTSRTAARQLSGVPPPPPPLHQPTQPNPKAGLALAKPSAVQSSGSDPSNESVRSSAASATGPASVAVAKVQTAALQKHVAMTKAATAAGVAVLNAHQRLGAVSGTTATQLAARAKARAAAGLPPLDASANGTLASADQLRRIGKKSTGDRGKRKRRSDPNLTKEEIVRHERRLGRRKRRRRITKRLERERIRHAAYTAQARHVQAQQNAAVAAAAAAAAQQAKPEPPRKGKAKCSNLAAPAKKTGPRTVEYICALCNETYMSSSDANPWWALRHQDCTKCGKRQVPRIDISAPSNLIEYHPALLAHAEDSSSGGGGGGSASVSLRKGTPATGTYIPPSSQFVSPPKYPDLGDLYASDSESSDEEEAVSLEGESSEESEDDDTVLGFNGPLSPAERAEAEDFGRDYAGPKMTESESARLMVLMAHASTCPGRHKTAKISDMCRGTKFMMLHVRDCPGTTSTFDVCPFPWCRKIKHLLYHLLDCTKPGECRMCSPKDLPPTLKSLAGLNEHRRIKQREKLVAAAAAAARVAASKASRAPPPHSQMKKNVPNTSGKLPVVKLPPTKFIPPPTSAVLRHPGAPGQNLNASATRGVPAPHTNAALAKAVLQRRPAPGPTSKVGQPPMQNDISTSRRKAPTVPFRRTTPNPTPNPILPTQAHEGAGVHPAVATQRMAALPGPTPNPLAAPVAKSESAPAPVVKRNSIIPSKVSMTSNGAKPGVKKEDDSSPKAVIAHGN